MSRTVRCPCRKTRDIFRCFTTFLFKKKQTNNDRHQMWDWLCVNTTISPKCKRPNCFWIMHRIINKVVLAGRINGWGRQREGLILVSHVNEADWPDGHSSFFFFFHFPNSKIIRPGAENSFCLSSLHAAQIWCQHGSCAVGFETNLFLNIYI